MANNKRDITVKCSTCGWLGDQGQTDSGHCPDCDGGYMPLDRSYGTQDAVQSGAHGTQVTSVSKNTAFVIGERPSDRLEGEQAPQALEVLNGTRKLD
jgi:hypothetical protein